MTYLKLRCKKIAVVFAATMALVSFPGRVTQVQASERPASPTPQSAREAPKRQKVRVRFIPPSPPQDIGTPGDREGAASRGACPLTEKPLTALVPVTQVTSNRQGGTKQLAMATSESVWSFTVASHPTFWFYVPFSPPSLKSAEFVLQDEQDNDVYRTVVLPRMSGIVSLSLPATSNGLEIGKPYHWFLKIDCTAGNTSVPIFVEGWVWRVTPNPTLANQLKTATPQQRFALYATNGIWQDALTDLAQLRLINPEDASLKADWNELLQSVSLADIASQPLLKCCTPAQ